MVTLLFLSCSIFAQNSLTGSRENHPRIYVQKGTRTDFSKKVMQVEWKSSIIQEKKERIDKYVELCKSEPNWLVSRLQMNWKTKHDKVFLKGGKFSHSEGEAPVPTVRFSGTRDWATDYMSPELEDIQPYFDDERGMYLRNKKSKEMEWVHPSETGHIIEGINAKIMAVAEDAAFLYWFTGDKKYAEFAAPVFDTYMKGMYYREAPVDLENGNQQRLSGLQTFEVIHEKIVISLALVYDFMFEYFAENNYDLSISTNVFQRWGDQIINNGVPDNNWNFFQARFLTFIALALDNNEYYKNGKGQQYYLDHTFEITTDRQIALKEAIRNYDYQSGIWPECASYSMHVTETLLKILTVLDNATNTNEFENFPIVEKATLASFQYLFPNGEIVAFGDSRHQSLPAASFEYLIANYRKYGKKEKESKITALYKSLYENGKRGGGLFELFFYVDELVKTEETNSEILIGNLTSPTFYASNVSWFAQSMGSGDNATMVSTFGALGNHAHANGVAIEMYANNYVLAPDMGKGPSYWHKDHRNYYSRYPAHNTVVVNGVSDSEAMRVSHPFKMENHFPETGKKDNVFKQLSFSNVSFVEPKTGAKQQRLTALINSKSGKPYVLDIFRSEVVCDDVQKHEYFYHNLGQKLSFFNEKEAEISMKSSTDLNSPGNLKAYEYFTDEQSFSSSENVRAVFKLANKSQPASIMKVWLKGGENRQYFSVLGPKSNALNKASVPAEICDAKVPAMVIRKNGEAWNNPFVAVFNPFFEGKDKAIANVTFGGFENTSAQQILITHSNNTTIDNIVACDSENDIAKSNSFYQKGLLSISRETEGVLDFIFASGITRFSWNGWQVLTRGKPVTTSIEKCARGFEIQNDGAVKIGIPKALKPTFMEIYENGKLIEERHGNINRNNPDRVDFLLEKGFERVVIVIDKN